MSKRARRKEKISTAMTKTIENALMDYADGAELTDAGKYRCRDCGIVFDTPEGHDEHHRVMHMRIDYYLSPGMTL